MRRCILSLVLFCAAWTSGVQAQTKTVFSKIQQKSGWQSCDVCSGAGGNGSSAVHWLAQFQTTPSLSGGSAEFYYGGPEAYSSALWWEQLGAMPTATHFTYDLYFYVTDATVPQALEFDVNQSLNGKKYIFGTECDLRGTYKGYWRVYDAKLHWTNTGVACAGITSAKWHHLTWQLERTSDGHTHFITVTIDGVTKTVNRYYTPTTSSAKELNIAVQTDGNKTGTAFSLWVDQITLTAW